MASLLQDEVWFSTNNFSPKNSRQRTGELKSISRLYLWIKLLVMSLKVKKNISQLFHEWVDIFSDYPVILRIPGLFSSSFRIKLHHRHLLRYPNPDIIWLFEISVSRQGFTKGREDDWSMWVPRSQRKWKCQPWTRQLHLQITLNYGFSVSMQVPMNYN